MNSWIVEVRIYNNATHVREWHAVRPSGSNEPYRYATEDEAQAMRRMCYPDSTEFQVRVRQEVQL